MKNILKSIERSIEDKNWYAALILSLVVPDICSKLEGGDPLSSKRYPAWFDKYLGKKYQSFLSGDDCYALRCAYLHEGIDNIELQKAKNVLDHFVFISSGSHCNRFNNCFFGDPIYDGKNFLQLSTDQFCKDIIEAANQWLFDVANSQLVQANIKEMLTIREKEFSIGGLRVG